MERSITGTILIMISSCPLTFGGQLSVDEVGAIRRELLVAAESHQDLSTQHLVFEISGDAATAHNVVEHHVLTSAGGLFREHIVRSPTTTNRFGDQNLIQSAMTLRAWNGTTYTEVKADQTVVHDQTVSPALPPFEPFGVLLRGLQFDGVLSDFLTPVRGLNEVSLTFEWESSTLAGASVLIIRRTAGLPGPSTKTITELQITRTGDANANTWIPLSGSVTCVVADGTITQICEAKLSHISRSDSGLSYQVKVQQMETASQAAVDREILTSSEYAHPPLSEHLFVLKQYSGNPVIHTRTNTTAAFSRQYYPVLDGAALMDEWTPLEKWFLVNDIAIAALFLWYVIRQLARTPHVTRRMKS